MKPILDLQAISDALPAWGAELGFSGVAVSRVELDADHDLLAQWVAEGRHAGMDWLPRSLPLRRDPQTVHPGTVSIISVKQPCWSDGVEHARDVLRQQDHAYIARYALGRDYHKSLRQGLRKLGQRLQDAIPECSFRVATDSAPLLEKALARDASLGWIGKNTLLLDAQDGSRFLLGEILTDLPLPPSRQPAEPDRCGECRACLTACPTQAFTAPRALDARRCIAYWTIEHKGTVPLEFREAIGNRVFGCDDCQLVCPWNRLASSPVSPDFAARHQLDAPMLLDLWTWTVDEFESRFAGMPIRRTGWLGWRRNLCIALGNMRPSSTVRKALREAPPEDCDWWPELMAWAISRQSRDAALT